MSACNGWSFHIPALNHHYYVLYILYLEHNVFCNEQEIYFCSQSTPPHEMSFWGAHIHKQCRENLQRYKTHWPCWPIGANFFGAFLHDYANFTLLICFERFLGANLSEVKSASVLIFLDFWHVLSILFAWFLYGRFIFVFKTFNKKIIFISMFRFFTTKNLLVMDCLFTIHPPHIQYQML